MTQLKLVTFLSEMLKVCCWLVHCYQFMLETGCRLILKDQEFELKEDIWRDG